jgi:putative aldouronate transport system permease protein
MKLGRFLMQTKVIKRKGKGKQFLPVYLMMLPGLLYLFINNYMPMAGLVVAFKQVNFSTGIWKSPWAGLKNFEFLFTTDEAMVITRNTILYNLAFIVIGIVLGIFLAVLITEVANKTLKKLYQSAVLVPFLMSIVIVSYIVYAFLGAEHGLLNNSVLPLLGKEPFSWYTQPQYWPFILVFVHTWKGIGYGCLIYISTINGIDKSLYEAAGLDGAGIMKQIRYVTLPCLKGTVITLTLLNIGKIFYADFGLFYQVPMNSGQLYDTTNVIDTYVYRALLQLGNSGMAAAAGFYQSVVGFVLVMISNGIVRKTSSENALF